MVRGFARAMDLLQEQHREVLLLIGLEGLTYKQATGFLDIPKGTLISRLPRAREKLKSLMLERSASTLRRVK
jgi:RNA polymerase sigma-70 factor (ECF subfamily)